MKQYLLTLDQGTTSTRAILFTTEGEKVAIAQQAHQQYFPQDGWVEHDAEEIWQAVLQVMQQVIKTSQINPEHIVSLGITNQRETTVLWDKQTGKPIYNAIVWQDRRTAEYCHQLVSEGKEKGIQQKTGLLIDPYFSATKIHWLLNTIPAAKKLLNNDQLAFGTIDTYLLWKLTNGKQYATDASNAARTLLFNIYTQQWDSDLLSLFNIPKNILPEVRDCSADYGVTEASVCGYRIPIGALIGDQQAAAVGQTCFQAGMIKSTYGTGCFMLVNTGDKAVQSQHRLLTTIAYRINGKTTYALEGSIFVAGAAVQWLRDTMKLIQNYNETETIPLTTPSTGGVYLVPAFTGLGAPYWDPLARGAILGLTRDSGVHHIVRAALESVCYQTRDLLQSIQADWRAEFTAMRVDGGMAVNDWLMQFLADVLNLTIERPKITETTALGAAYMAGLHAGVYSSLESIAALWKIEKTFTPKMESTQRESLYAGWQEAVKRIRVTQ